MYDVTVVGGGAAGLNAALVLGRARRRVAVVDAGEPRNAPAARMGGLLSRDGTAPAALLEAGRAEVTGYGGQMIDGRVNQVDRTGPGFVTRLADGRALRSRRVLVTTGLRDELPGIPGVRELWGRDVLHCPYCHGHEVADEPVGVLGTRVRRAAGGAVRRGADRLGVRAGRHRLGEGRRLGPDQRAGGVGGR